jgi:hypothetical protein
MVFPFCTVAHPTHSACPKSMLGLLIEQFWRGLFDGRPDDSMSLGAFVFSQSDFRPEQIVLGA